MTDSVIQRLRTRVDKAYDRTSKIEILVDLGEIEHVLQRLEDKQLALDGARKRAHAWRDQRDATRRTTKKLLAALEAAKEGLTGYDTCPLCDAPKSLDTEPEHEKDCPAAIVLAALKEHGG